MLKNVMFINANQRSVTKKNGVGTVFRSKICLELLVASKTTWPFSDSVLRVSDLEADKVCPLLIASLQDALSDG